MTRTLATALPVWFAVVVGVVLLLTLGAPSTWASAMPVIAASAVLLTFVIQVSLASKDGLVRRMLVSVTGVVLILAIASGLMLIIAGVR